MSEMYEGVVCFVGHDHMSEDGRELKGGWHYTVVESPSGFDMPGERLVLDENGYHLAGGEDSESHNALHSQRFADIVREDGTPAMSVTPEQLEQIQKILGEGQ